MYLCFDLFVENCETSMERTMFIVHLRIGRNVSLHTRNMFYQMYVPEIIAKTTMTLH